MAEINKQKKGNTNGFLMRKSKGKQPKKQKPKQQRRLIAAPRDVGLSECALKYAKVLENPFSGGVACVPTLTNFPTMKQSFRGFGVFSTGTTTGFVAISPATCLLSDTSSIFYTDNTYAGVQFLTSGVGVAGAMTNAIYPTASTTQQVMGRLVACGLRVRNITSLLNRGGQLVGLEAQNHVTLTGLSSNAVMNQDTCGRMSSASDSWQSVCWHPVDEDEFDFLTTTQMANQVITLGFIATSAGVSQTYEFEVYAVGEFKGNIIHGLTPSPSDPSGLAHVQNLTSTVATRRPQEGERGAWIAGLLGRAAGYGIAAYRAYSGASQLLAKPAIHALTYPKIEEID